MVFAASQRAKRKPRPASLGCRGPIRMSGFNLSNLWALNAWSCTHGNDANLHQSQLPPGNNAVSSYGISTCLQVLMRLARLGGNKPEKIKGENDAGSYAEPCCADSVGCRRNGRHHGVRAEEIRSRRQR